MADLTLEVAQSHQDAPHQTGYSRTERRVRRQKRDYARQPAGSPRGGEFAKTTTITESYDGYQHTLTLKTLEGQEMGSAKLRRVTNNSKMVEFDILHIEPSARGKGAGEYLYRAAADKAKALGGTHLVGDVTSAGVLRLGIKVLGQPEYVADAINEMTVAEAMKRLEPLAPENAEGIIDTGNYLAVRWPLTKRRYARKAEDDVQPVAKTYLDVLKWEEAQHPRDEVGQFTRVAMTSQRPSDDPEHKANKDVFKHMRQFEAQLKAVPGVSRVSVKPGVGGWEGGSESMWQIYYKGNGEARKLVAVTAKQYNQDSVLILHKCHADCQPAVELAFRGGISPANREHIHQTMLDHGVTGWTWMKRGGKSVLRMVNVPQWSTWGADGEKHQAATATISQELKEDGLDNHRKVHKVEVSVMERGGAHSYDRIIGGA